MQTLHWLIVAWALGIMLSDLTAHRIPNVLSLGAVLGGLAYITFTGQAVLGATWLNLLLGVLFSLLLTLPGYLLRWLGAGDVKLLLAIAILGGWQYVAASFAIAGLACGVWLMICKFYLAWHGRGLPAGRWLPFGAMLSLGLIASVGAKA